eukprot:m.91256 g.91256  ORF g.91256 m.91256 type:complete len:387 (+) comp13298_c0_seq2:75-1235(+)
MRLFLKAAAGSLLGGAAYYATNNNMTLPVTARAEASKSKTGTIIDAIGNTPLIELKSLSAKTGCRILAKAEFMNPGGSVKDRAALWLVEDAEKKGKIKPGYTITEGTGGNTGIGLALVAAAKGYNAILTMPKSIAQEKINTMKTLGAEVILCESVPFDNANHYFHVAQNLEDTRENTICMKQFENTANAMAHYNGTAPEMWEQSGGNIDGFVCASGTGGTIGGVSTFLKEKNPKCTIYLIDAPGSGLFDAVQLKMKGEPSFHEKKGTAQGKPITWLARSKGSTIMEGIGTDRKTKNFALALDNDLIDGAFKGDDQEAVSMAYHLLRKEGVFVGPSAALNVVGAVKLAEKLGPGHTVVTVLCDGGDRYRSKMYNKEWLEEKGLSDTL